MSKSINIEIKKTLINLLSDWDFKRIFESKERTDEEGMDYYKSESRRDELLEMRESIEQSGIEKGLERGFERGREEGLAAVALNMKEMRFAVDQITSATDLLGKYINKL